MKTRTRSIAITDTYTERRIAKALLVAIGLSVAAYGLFIGLASYAIVHRIALQNQTKELNATINAMELSYLAQTEAINLNYVHEKGFLDATGNAYAGAANVAINVR